MKHIFIIFIFFYTFMSVVLSSRSNNDDDNSILIDTRIVGGKPARPSQFPYQVGLQITKHGRISWCSGAIISKDYIITAAHCLDGATQAIAFYGSNKQGNIYQPGQKMVQLAYWNFIKHEDYEYESVKNDIALIKLPESLEFNSNVSAVQLPNKDMYTEGLKVIASGWGTTSDANKVNSNILQYVSLNLITLEECKKFFHSYIRSQHYCADGKNKKSTCTGDSGGPIVTEIDNNKTILIGLVSFGGDSCQKGYPSVFTNVYSYLDWIHKKTNI